MAAALSCLRCGSCMHSERYSPPAAPSSTTSRHKFPPHFRGVSNPYPCSSLPPPQKSSFCVVRPFASQRNMPEDEKKKSTPSSWVEEEEEMSRENAESAERADVLARRIRNIQSGVNAPMQNPPWLEGDRSGIYDLLVRNRTWAQERKSEFRPLEMGQQPQHFVICCSDSRCPSERMMGFKSGECFTVRNIGNCVMSGDLSINAAMQYAVDVLKVKDIIVVGHRDCGGVKAAMTTKSFGTTIDMYVRHIRDVYRQHIHEIDAYENPNDRLNSLIQLHVIEQCVNVYKMGPVQRARRNSRVNGSVMYPQIHGLMYDPSTGLLDQLDVGIRAKARAYGKVYDVMY
ncbi:hypothetical protein BASA81_005538 [Batrachochytrium salamandrivorans]|nr:hypothetical protein BASA81_005538 [Batrachochytrium salamandrivorans]